MLSAPTSPPFCVCVCVCACVWVCNDVWLCQGRELKRVGGGVSSHPAPETKCMGVCKSVCVKEGGRGLMWSRIQACLRCWAERRRRASQEDLREEQTWGSDSPARLQSPTTAGKVSWGAIPFFPFIIENRARRINRGGGESCGAFMLSSLVIISGCKRGWFNAD